MAPRLAQIVVHVILFFATSRRAFGEATSANFPGCGHGYSRSVLNDFLEASGSATREVEPRVVNGKPAGPSSIPWAALIIMSAKSFSRRKKSIVCTGSLISHYHVVAAAHCFCTIYGCEERGQVDWASWRIIDQVEVALGASGPGDAVWSKIHSFSIHSNYRAFEGNDVALIALRKYIHFDRRVQPICLPSRGFKVKADEIVQTAGFGHRYAEGKHGTSGNRMNSCLTNEVGPSKFEVCRSSCSKGRYFPGYDGAKCRSTYKKALRIIGTKSFEVDIVQTSNGERCFNPEFFHSDGICRDKWGKWGFCSRSCNFIGSVGPKQLEYATLKVQGTASNLCDVHEVEEETCAGGFIPASTIAHVKVGVGNEWVLDNITHEKARVESGYQDSCSGDSGGPLWTYSKDEMGRRYGVLLGATSRGPDVCGAIGTAAIYTNIASPTVYNWILDNVGENFGNVRIHSDARAHASPSLVTLAVMVFAHP